MRCATASSSTTRRSDGLLSDNIGKVFDDGESLWLSTTRGICRIAKSAAAGLQRRQANASGAAKLRRGGRAAQRAVRSRPIRPAAAGSAPPTAGFGSPPAAAWRCSIRMRASRWRCRRLAHLVQMTANGDPVDLSQRGAPGAGQRAPADPLHGHPSERAGAGAVLLQAGGPGSGVGDGRRTARDQLQQPAPRALSFRGAGGTARRPGQRAVLRVRNAAAVLGDGVVPGLVRGGAAGGGVGGLPVRLRQIRSRFALVLEERARLAREIHDTLAQGFVGISSQLDAVAMCMPEDATPARSLSGHGAAHGAAQPDRGAAQRDGSARVGAGGAGSGGGASNRARGCGPRDRVWRSRWTSRGPGSKLPRGDGAAPAAHRAGGRDQRAEARRAPAASGSSCTWRRASCTCGSWITAAASISRTCFRRAAGISG